MEYLWTPWRSTYMQAKNDKRHCIFCEAGAGSEDDRSLVVYRGQFSFVILNRYPYTTGHVMIAPYSHVSRLTLASEEASAEIMRLMRKAENVIEDIYHPNGLNLGMNLGEAAGAGIEQHIHMHVLPRWIGDANFMTSVSSTRVLPESLNDTYRKMKKAYGMLI